MNPIPANRIITANGDWTLPAASPGTERLLEISGTFGSGTITLGYIDAAGAFAAYRNVNAVALTMTAADSAIVAVPSSGVVVIRLASATGPALRVTSTKIRAAA